MNYRKVLISSLVALLILSSAVLGIQRFTIRGKIINAQTCEGLEGIKIKLTQVDNGIVSETETGSSGTFKKTFTLYGTVKIDIEDPGYSSFSTQILNRLGDTDLGLIPLVSTNEPLTAVCEDIADTPIGREIKKSIVEVPVIPEEQGLSQNYQDAKTALEIKDYDSALPLLLEEFKTNADNYAVNFYLGLVYFNQDKFDDAIKHWNKCQETNAERYLVLANLAKAWEKKGDNLKAAEYYQKYAEELEKDPERKVELKADAYFEAGNYWYNAGANEKYFKMFTKVTELTPGNGDAWYFIGMYYFATQKNKEALESFEKALENNISETNKQTAVAFMEAIKSSM